MANEMVLHEMFTRKIESRTLARQLGLTEKELASVLRFDLSEEEQLRLLATDGMLVKRPLVIGEGFVLVGFHEKEWAERLAK